MKEMSTAASPVSCFALNHLRAAIPGATDLSASKRWPGGP
jgi:hypothetical protein